MSRAYKTLLIVGGGIIGFLVYFFLPIFPYFSIKVSQIMPGQEGVIVWMWQVGTLVNFRENFVYVDGVQSTILLWVVNIGIALGAWFGLWLLWRAALTTLFLKKQPTSTQKNG